jgi:hypothetical protein
VHPHILSHNPPFLRYLLPYALIERGTERGKKRKEKRKKKKEKRDYRDFGGVASPFFSSHGRVGLDSFQGYAESPAKPHKTSADDGGRAHGLSCATGPCIP